jgi:hypothetical protein
MLLRGERRWRASSTSSLSATRHVVDQRPIDVGTSQADGIEEDIGIGDKVLLIGQFVGDDLRIAGLAEHHQPTRYAYSFSSCTSSQDALHRSFLPRQPKVFRFEINPTYGTFIHLLTGRQLDFIPIDSPTADMIKPPARILII